MWTLRTKRRAIIAGLLLLLVLLRGCTSIVTDVTDDDDRSEEQSADDGGFVSQQPAVPTTVTTASPLATTSPTEAGPRRLTMYTCDEVEALSGPARTSEPIATIPADTEVVVIGTTAEGLAQLDGPIPLWVDMAQLRTWAC